MKNRIFEIEEMLQDVIGKLVILSGNAFFMEEVLRKLMLETRSLLTFIETVPDYRQNELQEILDRVKKRVEYAEAALNE